jgi:hypothetical protein
MLAAVCLTALMSSRAAGQAERPLADLVASVPAVAAVIADGAATGLTIRWVVTDSASGEPVDPATAVAVNSFEVAARARVQGPLPRERDPQWSEDEIVIVAVDAVGRETSWQKVQDPRLVRAELPGPSGELRGERLHRPLAEIVTIVPDAAASVRIFETRWTGAGFVLRELGQVNVTAP